MIKVVLDTNIFVSSIFWELGNPHKVVELALDRKIQVFVSKDILDELERILKRDFKEPKETTDAQISLILEYAKIVEPVTKVFVIKDDPEDNKILECAEACNADVIISGDSHLLDKREYKWIKILNAKEFLNFF